MNRAIEIAYPEHVSLKELHLEVHDESGQELWDYVDHQPGDRGRPYRRILPMPLGRIEVRVETDVDLSGRLDFEMTTLEPGQLPVRVELR